MKIERISQNKVKIILTLDELKKRKISVRELEKDNALARDLFFDLIEETNLDEELQLDGSQLLIEASSDNKDLFIVTITIVDVKPSTFKQFSGSDIKSPNTKSNCYKVSSNIYEFNSMDNILEFCEKSKEENLFFGRNSLYKENNRYYLVFSKNAVKNKKFIKTFIFLSEYCTAYYDYDMLEVSIKETSKLIIANSAIQKLKSI